MVDNTTLLKENNMKIILTALLVAVMLVVSGCVVIN